MPSSGERAGGLPHSPQLEEIGGIFALLYESGLGRSISLDREGGAGPSHGGIVVQRL